MLKWIDDIARLPKMRMFTSIGGSTVVAIVVGVYTNVITPIVSSSFNWKLLYTGGHSVCLLLVLIAWIYLNWRFSVYDESVSRFADDVHCRAYVRQARLEAYAKRIREDPAQADLINVRDLMKQLGIKP